MEVSPHIEFDDRLVIVLFTPFACHIATVPLWYQAAGGLKKVFIFPFRAT